ncbi:MAG: hypothetical protein JW827_02830 [Spirochaetes bacterium]|nr:hypothetical protein [Spirochaetota bacterium]
MKKNLILIIMILFFSYLLKAEEDIFTDRYNARAAGLGNNFVALANDSTAVFYNPAGLGLIERSSFNSMYADINANGIIKNFIVSGGGAYQDISMGLGWCLESVDLDPESWYQHRIYYGASYFLFDKIHVGLGSKLMIIQTEIYENDSIWGYGFDGGLLLSSDNWDLDFMSDNEVELRVGIMLRDVYTQIEWSENNVEDLPFALIFGGNLNYYEMINISAQFTSQKKSLAQFGVGGEFYLLKLLDYQFAEEYKITDIVLRGGIQIENIYRTASRYSFGIGLVFNQYCFDYAIVYQMDYLPATHYFSLNVNNWSL